MDIAVKVSNDFRRIVSSENLHGWTSHGDTTLSINTLEYYTGKGALNVTKTGTGVAYANAIKSFQEKNFTDKMFSIAIFVQDQATLDSLTATPFEINLVDYLSVKKKATITASQLHVGEFTVIHIPYSSFTQVSTEVDDTRIASIEIQVNTDSTGITWTAGKVIVNDISFQTYNTQVINPNNLHYTDDLMSTNFLEFTLSIEDENIVFLNEWKKLEVYSVENGIDTLIWTGQIVDMKVNLREVTFTCFDEKTYLQKKRIIEDKDWTGMTVDQVLTVLVDDIYDRSKENMEFETNFDNGYTLIESLNDTTGWSASTDGVLATSGSIYKQGIGSVDLFKTGTTALSVYMEKTISSTDFTGKYVTFFVYISEDLLANENFLSLRLSLYSDSSNYLTATFNKADLISGEWNKLQILVSNMVVTGTPNVSAIVTARIYANTGLITTTWQTGSLFFDELISTTTPVTINALIGDIQSKKGASYADILNELVGKIGGEYRVEKNRIIYKETIGADKTQIGNFVEFSSTIESPNANNILDVQVDYLGRDIATTLILNSASGSVVRTGDTSEFGHLDDFLYVNEGDVNQQANESITKRQKRQRNIKIDVDASVYAMSDIVIGDIVQVRVERNNVLLDMQLKLKVIQKSVTFTNFSFTYTIVLKIDSDQVRSASNIFARFVKRLEQLEIEQ